MLRFFSHWVGEALYVDLNRDARQSLTFNT